MNRFYLAFITLVTLCVQLRAQPLIVTSPVSVTAFVGDSSASFEAVATSTTSATYRWQIDSNGLGGWSNLSNDSTYSGVTTAILTVNNPGLALNGKRFRVMVTDTAGSTASATAKLYVYAAPSIVPTLTVTPASLTADSTGSITVTVSGLPSGSEIRMERILDANADGQVSTGEATVQSALLTDGRNTTKSWSNFFENSIEIPLSPGDDDGTVDGTITTHLSLSELTDFSRTAGNHLVRIVSPTGLFRPIMSSFTLTQPGQTQTISGQVTSNGNPVPYACIDLLDSDDVFLGAVVSDATGHYSISAPTGPLKLIPLKQGYTASPTLITITTGQTITSNLTLVPATRTVTGGLYVSGEFQTLNSYSSLPSVEFLARSSSGSMALAYTDADGNYTLGVTADAWEIKIPDKCLKAHLFARPRGAITTDTTSASQTLTVTLNKADALIYGTVNDAAGTPISGVTISTNDPGLFGATTDADGKYYIRADVDLLTVGSRTLSIALDQHNPALAGYTAPVRKPITISALGAAQVNFTVVPATAHISGQVTLNGVPLAGLTIGANPSNHSSTPSFFSTITDLNGNYDLALTADTWTVHIDAPTGLTANIVSPTLTCSVVDGQTLTNVDISVVEGLHHITGAVTRSPGSGSFSLSCAYLEIFATATIDGVNYITSAFTDSAGIYSLPVINGDWHIVDSRPYANVVSSLPVNGGDLTQNFIHFPLWPSPDDFAVFAGQEAYITYYELLLAPFFFASRQWETSTDNVNWTPLTDDAIYTGSTTSSLTIKSAPISLNGRYYRLRGTDYSSTSYTSAGKQLTVIPATYDLWRQHNFTTEQSNDSAISGPTATPAGDGVSNLLKYAFNLPPLEPTTSPIPAPVATGDTLTLAFEAIRPELTYTVEVSTDLTTWSTDGVTLQENDTQRIATYSTTGVPRAFLRIRVTQ